ncbi:MAG: hypothetical protein P4L16_06295 [Chlamydiales bacterium]|nr:hypothetical protein [Chlamydiales bacterium]
MSGTSSVDNSPNLDPNFNQPKGPTGSPSQAFTPKSSKDTSTKQSPLDLAKSQAAKKGADKADPTLATKAGREAIVKTIEQGVVSNMVNQNFDTMQKVQQNAKKQASQNS